MPMPSYEISKERACRTCAWLVITLAQEYPHPRIRLECPLGHPCSLKGCDDWQREMGVD